MATPENLKNIVEAALLAAGRPLTLDTLLSLFIEDVQPDRKALREILLDLSEDYQGRGIEVKEVSSGWRIQVRSDYAAWVSRLWEDKPGRYSRALMETLALIAYRQPITRGEIEEIRGVSVSTYIVKTLLEREWIRVLGQRDVPGRPSLYGTTREFLDYFNLKALDELPTLAEIRDLDEINRELDLEARPSDTDDTEPVSDAAEVAESEGETTDPASEHEAIPDAAEEIPADRKGDVSTTGSEGSDDASESAAEDAADAQDTKDEQQEPLNA